MCYARLFLGFLLQSAASSSYLCEKCQKLLQDVTVNDKIYYICYNFSLCNMFCVSKSNGEKLCTKKILRTVKF